MTTIIPQHTGILSVSPRGRVGSYESAVRRHRCRARHHWVIEEDLHEVLVTTGEDERGKWEQRTKQVERTDCGTFKTKTAAIQFLCAYAAKHGLVMEGNLEGYPRLQIPLK